MNQTFKNINFWVSLESYSNIKMFAARSLSDNKCVFLSFRLFFYLFRVIVAT